MSELDKEDAARTVFGIGSNDGGEFGFLTAEQLKSITEILTLTDELDAIYDQERGLVNYVMVFAKVEAQYEAARSALPAQDIRVLLLRATVKSYTDIGSLLLGAERNQWQGDPSPTVMAARMRKLFTRKIIVGDLDAEGQACLNYLIGK